MFASLVILLSSTFGFFNHKYIEETFRVKDNPDVIFSKRNIGTLVTLVTSVVMVLLLALMVANKYILRQSEYFSKNPIKPWQVETGCTFFLDNTSGARNLCNYGFQNGRFQIVLIGDSHAATLTDSLIDLANKYEFELYVSTQAGCPFLTSKTNLESILSTIVSDQCIKRNNWLTKEIGKLAPEYTIYVNRSTQDYLTEKSPDTRYLFFKTIQANLAQLESKSVLFIGPNPEITVPNSLGAYLKGQVAQWNKTPKLDDVILRDLESSHKLRYVSLSKLLCPADSCSSTRISSIILADRDHLSSYGANLVTRHILQIIESMRF
jgi:hypothetical protein